MHFTAEGGGSEEIIEEKKKKTEESKGDLKKECDTGTAGKARLETGGFWNGGGPGTGQLAEMTCRQPHLRQGRGMLGDRRGREPAWASSVSGPWRRITHQPPGKAHGIGASICSLSMKIHAVCFTDNPEMTETESITSL